jgi:cholesterol transport system auxiliary component
LKQAAFCLAVIDSDSLLPATHLLEGTVDDFFEDDTENGWQAVLTLSLTLSTTRTGNADPRILMQRTYRARKACRAKNPQAVAEAMSLAMADVSKHVLGDIYEQLAQQKKLFGIHQF